MEIKIKLLKPISDAVGKKELELEFHGSNLKDLIKILIDKYPKLRKEFYTKTNELTDYLCIFVNDKSITTLNGLKTRLKNSDEILFFLPISGG